MGIPVVIYDMSGNLRHKRSLGVTVENLATNYIQLVEILVWVKDILVGRSNVSNVALMWRYGIGDELVVPIKYSYSSEIQEGSRRFRALGGGVKKIMDKNFWCLD